MDYKQIESINKALPTVPVKGKKYAMVKDKILGFRKEYPDAEVDTEITYYDGKQVCVKATIKIDGKQVGSGLAEEKCGNSFINETSFVENCETSAIGRALSNLGIGIGDSYASAEEVANAMLNQKPNAKDLQKLEKLIDDIGLLGRELNYEKILNQYKAKVPTDLSLDSFNIIYGRLMATKEELEKGNK